MNLDHIPIIDHHAHPLLTPDATRGAEAFRSWFTESTDPEIHARHVPHTLFFRTALRWLAQRLGCEPTLEAVLTARAAQPEDEWIRRLFADANIEILLCDYGFGGPDAYDHAAMTAKVPCRVEPMLRLETLAESLVLPAASFAEFVDAFGGAVSRARADGHVALKSIVAYRTGLALETVSESDAAAAFAELRNAAQRTGRVRLEQKPLCDFLLARALPLAADQGLPVQFHTGFGDRDADLRWANPLHLRATIEAFPEVPLVLLHAGWPYSRELAHLAAIYPNVWMDLSLAIPFATVGIPAMLREVLGMAPFSKLLFATDAFTMPEIYWLAARWGRWGLGTVLDELVASDFLTTDEALGAATDILGENARRLYELG